MKSADIEAILDANPNARFARVPSDYATQVQLLTDLKPRGGGYWDAKRSGQRTRLSSRVICPAEDAEAKVAETIERNAEHYSATRFAERVVEELAAAGVTATSHSGRVIVEGHDNLKTLIDFARMWRSAT